MGLEDPNKLDAIGTDKLTGELVLTIVDSWEWESEQQALYRHLMALREKFNAYLAFIQSGQLREMYPNSTGQRIRIDLLTRFALPEIAKRFLNNVASVAAHVDVTIRLQEAVGG